MTDRDVIDLNDPGWSDAAMRRAIDEWSAHSRHPMAVVTAAAAGRKAGCLVGLHNRVAVQPARYLVCLSTANWTYDVAAASPVLAVHLLDGADHRLASLFGERSGDSFDKFEHCDWRPGPGGVPLLDDLANRMVGRVLSRVAFGDHTGFVLQPFLVTTAPLTPMTSADAVDLEAGHPV